MESSILNAIAESRLQVAGQAAVIIAELQKVASGQRQKVIERWQVENKDDLNDILGQFSKAVQEEDSRRIAHLIIHSLDFSEREDRHAMIPKAHVATFAWIFEENPTKPVDWSDFVEWLSTNNSKDNLYWITGKPGSGKSTLMRYLSNEPCTTKFLQRWAQSRQLITARCFFWNSGSELQKSIEGLLRSLLVQLLNHVSSLSKEVNPWRWQSYQLGASILVPWTHKELLDCLEYTIRRLTETANLCLFIDGLDEFQGDTAACTDLNSLLIGLARSSTVKVCVSSRPYLLFRDAFNDSPSLQLHHLTQGDIKRYVKIELIDNEMFLALVPYNATGCAELAQEIVDKAQGVFFWVFLVVRDLVACLRNGDGIADLQRKLESIPSDLDQYFSTIMGQLEGFYLEQAYELFQVATDASEPLSLLTYSYIRGEVGYGSTEARCSSMERRLMSRCKGLLEAYYQPADHHLFRGRVGFLHRTVRDFLLASGLDTMMRNLQDKSLVSCRPDVNLIICRSLLFQIKDLVFDIKHQDPFNRMLSQLINYAIRYERSTKHALITILDDLDLVVTGYFQSTQRLPPEDHWTNYMEMRLENNSVADSRVWIHEREWRDTFPSFAFMAGLHIYFKEKLAENPGIIHSKSGRPLLDYVLRPHIGARPGTPRYLDKDILTILLEQGADPNQLFGRNTVFGHFVHSFTDESLLNYDELYAAMDMLIKHGAQSDISDAREKRGIFSSDQKGPARSIIDSINACFNEKDAREFTRALRSRSKRMYIRKLVHIF